MPGATGYREVMQKIKAQALNFIRHPLFSGSVIMIGGSTLASALGYLYHLIMGRILGPVDYGTLASLFAILQIVSIVPISSSFAIVKFIADTKDAGERAEVYISIKNFMWKLAVVVSLVLFLAAPAISGFLNIKGTLAVFFVGPITFLSLITLIDQAAMQGMLKFIGVAAPTFFSALFKLTLGVLLVVLGLSVNGAVGGMLLGLLLTYFITVKIRGNLFGSKPKKHFEIKRFLKYAFPVLIMALAFTSMFTVDLVMVKHFLPPFEAGIYAALSNLGKIIFFASQPITQTMFPIVSKRKATGERYRNVFWAAFLLTAVLSLGIVVFYWLFPDFAIGILYGSKYLAAKDELVWMGIFVAVYTVSYLLVNLLLSLDHTKVTIFPALAAVGQVVGIAVWHDNLLQVVRVNLASALFIFATVSIYLSYSQIQKVYAKK